MLSFFIRTCRKRAADDAVDAEKPTQRLTEKPTERAPERLAGKATESDENMRFCRSVQVQGIRFRRIAADVPHLRRGAQHDEKAGPAGRSRISEFRHQPTQTQLSESAVDSSIVQKYETEYNGKIPTKEINEEEFTPQRIATGRKSASGRRPSRRSTKRLSPS